jgi:hypothetical protein
MSLIENTTRVIFDNYKNPIKGLCPNKRFCSNYSEISYDCNIERNMSFTKNRFPCYKADNNLDNIEERI